MENFPIFSVYFIEIKLPGQPLNSWVSEESGEGSSLCSCDVSKNDVRLLWLRNPPRRP